MTLDAGQRRAFAALADVLIPASGPMPSAAEAGVPDALVDQALGYRPDLSDAFIRALASCSGADPEAALGQLAADSPDQFEALTVLTAGAYFLSTRVKAALSYTPPPRPAHEDTDTYVDMLAEVVDRGFPNRCDRPTKDSR
ncbi:hypothetical protein [Sciscionella marina]|uniref:hypothetical protein n=1 Tax=Sciscionella marina TaxID=508770 RepID=UPI0003691FE7|nr:hypothetical protein [Sciscionella marina]